MIATEGGLRQSRNRPKSVRSCHVGLAACTDGPKRRAGSGLWGSARSSRSWSARTGTNQAGSRLMGRQPAEANPRHVSLVALPDAVVSTLFGIFDVMNGVTLMGASSADGGARRPFQVEIVGEKPGPLELASGVPITVQRAIDTVDASDIVIVPSVLLPREGWDEGRYPRLVD